MKKIKSKTSFNHEIHEPHEKMLVVEYCNQKHQPQNTQNTQTKEIFNSVYSVINNRSQVRTENSNKPHGFGILDPATFTPFPKNPIIAAFFREIHRADELGSGMRNMMKYGKAFGGYDPQMEESDIFKIVIKCPDFDTNEDRKTSGKTAIHQRLESRLAAKVMLLVKDVESGKAQLATGLGHKTVSGELHKQIRRLLDLELIEMTIPDKPQSSKQKYRLTNAGKSLLNSMQE